MTLLANSPIKPRPSTLPLHSALAMNDVDDFFAEQDRRMSFPDEDVDEYIQMRLAAPRRNQYVIGPP